MRWIYNTRKLCVLISTTYKWNFVMYSILTLSIMSVKYNTDFMPRVFYVHLPPKGQGISQGTRDTAHEKQCFRITWNKFIPGEMTKMKDTDKINMSSSKWNDTCNHFVTLHSHKGRTGNQMFQIAAVFGVAFEYDFIPVVSPSLPLLKYFDLPNVSDIKLKNSITCKQPLAAVYHKCLNSTDKSNVKNITLHGYFQSWKYLTKADDVIRAIFKIKSDFLNAAKLFIRSHSKDGHKNTCIHVRRGDMTSAYEKRQGRAVVDAAFIYKAIRLCEDRFKAAYFFVLSDDIPWCKKNIKHERVAFSNFTEVGYDLALMMLCDHVVVTSGSFGWWGAWLSKGATVYFSGYPRPGSIIDKQYKREDYYPPQWIGLT